LSKPFTSLNKEDASVRLERSREAGAPFQTIWIPTPVAVPLFDNTPLGRLTGLVESSVIASLAFAEQVSGIAKGLSPVVTPVPPARALVVTVGSGTVRLDGTLQAGATKVSDPASTMDASTMLLLTVPA